MNRVLPHVVLPGLATLMIVGLYLTPVTVIPCLARGLMALAVVSVALVAALVTVSIGVSKRIKGQPDSSWWILSTVVLILPALLVLGPLG